MNLLLPLLMIPAPTVHLDPKSIQGEWEGWGTSLCWMGKAFGDRDDISDLLFTTKSVRIGDEVLPGLGLNIVRYNAGACSWNAVDGRQMVVGKGIQPFRQMEGFWLDSNKGKDGWDWLVDKNQRAMMSKAKKRGANRFELFSNSPMWWMCANNNPSGAAKAENDNLDPSKVDAFTDYLAEVASYAQNHWNIRFTSIEPFNEPLSAWWHENGKQEGCHFSIEMQKQVLRSLKSALERIKLKIPIAASDETYVTHALRAWQGYGPEIQSLVSQVNVHGYEGENAPRSELRDLVANRPVWVSEHGEGEPTGREMAVNIGLDFQRLKPRAWCYWQPLDGGGWGFLDSDLPAARVRKSNIKYFVMAQYSRHIRPGMVILSTGRSDVLAAWDRNAKKVVLVITNLEPTEVNRTLAMKEFPLRFRTTKGWITEFRGESHYRSFGLESISSGTLTVKAPALSVITVEVS